MMSVKHRPSNRVVMNTSFLERTLGWLQYELSQALSLSIVAD